MISREILREEPSWSPDQLVNTIDATTESLVDKAQLLRPLLRHGKLYVLPEGDEHDRVIVATALMAIVAQAIDVHSPYLRRIQISTVEAATQRLKLDYRDVLDLVRDADAIAALLFATAPT